MLPVFVPPLINARLMLSGLGIKIQVHHPERIPSGSLLVVSNHRSFLDTAVIMTALDRTIYFACHHYMSQVPLLREVVGLLGGFPLAPPGARPWEFLGQAQGYLAQGHGVGVFPEGATPMIQAPPVGQVGTFERGFAHLALKAAPLTILPVAILPRHEQVYPLFPLAMLSLFDPTEPLFKQMGWHPLVIYPQVAVCIGQPLTITGGQYQGRGTKALAQEITNTCYEEVQRLLGDKSHA